MKNIQEIFNTVVTHLLTQRAVSGVPNTEAEEGDPKFSCLYRHPDGLTCAVGCLIKDEFYEKRFEGLRATADNILDALSDSGVDTSSKDVRSLLLDLQGVHDNDYVENWDSALSKLQRKYHLDEPDILHEALQAREALQSQRELDKIQREEV